MFGIFKNKNKIEGSIGYFGIEDWWLNELTPKDRDLINKAYQPMGGGSLTEGKILQSSQTLVGFYSGLISWFSKPDTRYLAYIFIKKAESAIDAGTKILDIHFLYQSKLEIYYKDRDAHPDALDYALTACEQQISYAEQAAEEFSKQFSDDFLPSHKGYKQLAIVLEKQKKYDEAIRLCEKAKSQGWSGDWEKRIQRCNTKSA